jgi:Protein of unknown function (DUF1569)
MQNLFQPEAATGIVMRIARLKPTAQALWGKMNAAQMLAHCKAPLEVALGDRILKHSFVGWLFGRMAKKKMLGEAPFKHNLPTDNSFIVKENRDFAGEQDNLLTLIRRFAEANPASIAARTHPFFGKMSIEEWGILQWKHLDHHLRQFGV